MKLSDYMVFVFWGIGLVIQITAEYRLNRYLENQKLEFYFPKRTKKLMQNESPLYRRVGIQYRLWLTVGLVLFVIGIIIALN